MAEGDANLNHALTQAGTHARSEALGRLVAQLHEHLA